MRNILNVNTLKARNSCFVQQRNIQKHFSKRWKNIGKDISKGNTYPHHRKVLSIRVLVVTSPRIAEGSTKSEYLFGQFWETTTFSNYEGSFFLCDFSEEGVQNFFLRILISGKIVCVLFCLQTWGGKGSRSNS